MAAAAAALPSPFRNMPSRAAECHIRGEATVTRLLNPHENKRCVVKLLGDLFPSYELRTPGSMARGSVRQEAPQGIYEVFPIRDPKTTFGSRRACSDAVHRMLRATPVVGDFDLASANWDEFLPDDVAGLVLRSLGGDQAGCYDIVISLKIWVTVVDDMAAVEDMAECSICLSDLLKDQDSVRLPGCSHDFHRSCLTPWLHKAKTCPMCRAVMPSHVLYSLMHPQRRQ